MAENELEDGGAELVADTLDPFGLGDRYRDRITEIDDIAGAPPGTIDLASIPGVDEDTGGRVTLVGAPAATLPATVTGGAAKLRSAIASNPKAAGGTALAGGVAFAPEKTGELAGNALEKFGVAAEETVRRGGPAIGDALKSFFTSLFGGDRSGAVVALLVIGVLLLALTPLGAIVANATGGASS